MQVECYTARIDAIRLCGVTTTWGLKIRSLPFLKLCFAFEPAIIDDDHVGGIYDLAGSPSVIIPRSGDGPGSV